MRSTTVLPHAVRVSTATGRSVRSTVGWAAMAGTANTVIRQLGGALGVAVIGGVFAAGLTAGHAPLDVVHTCLAILLAVLATSPVASGALLARRAA